MTFCISGDFPSAMLRIFPLQLRGTLFCTKYQFEPAEWLDQIPIPVAAEAITDRLSAKAYRIIIQGNRSMRSVD